MKECDKILIGELTNFQIDQIVIEYKNVSIQQTASCISNAEQIPLQKKGK